MSDYLQKIVYLTQSDYDILAQGTEENPASVTKNGITLTNLDENCLYITDGGVVNSDISGIIGVPHGGTGKDTLLSGQVLVGNGENPITTIVKTSANTANTLVQRDANGDFSARNITMTQGNIGSMTLSGTKITALTAINTTGDYGILAYKPPNWTGVSSSQWGVGTVDIQGVIRSNNSDLLHSRAGSNSVILDAGNYKTYAYALDGSNTGTKLQISTQSAAYTNGIQFMNSTTKKGSIGSDSNGVIGIYGSKIALRPQLDAASIGVEITTDAMYPSASMTLGTTSKKWSTIYATNLNGNLNVAAHSNTTNGTKSYYPWFSTAQNGSLAAQAYQGFYIFETVTNDAISQLDFCMGNTGIKGSVTLWGGGTHWGNIIPSNLTSNRSYTLPDATGTIALTSSDITGTAAKATADASGNTITTTYAPLASPTFTGTPKAPTAANGTSTTQIATTEFVNNTLAYANAMTFKGTLGTGGTITSLPASHNAGDTYRVITAGTWAGKYCEVGTLVICITDGTAVADADWTSVETNEDGAVIGPASSTDNAIVRFDGTTGRVVQNSKAIIDDDGHLLITHTSGKSNEIEVKYSTTIDYWWGVGTANANHGLYDDITDKWILSAGADNKWNFDGNSTTATTATNLSAAPTIASGGTATVNLSANTTYTLTVGGKSVIFKTPADSNTDTKVNYTLAATTKAYLMASSDAPTSTATGREAKGDSNVYLTATAGELSAVRHSYNVSGTEKAYSYYNTTLNSIDFVFV